MNIFNAISLVCRPFKDEIESNKLFSFASKTKKDAIGKLKFF